MNTVIIILLKCLSDNSKIWSPHESILLSIAFVILIHVLFLCLVIFNCLQTLYLKTHL